MFSAPDDDDDDEDGDEDDDNGDDDGDNYNNNDDDDDTFVQLILWLLLISSNLSRLFINSAIHLFNCDLKSIIMTLSPTFSFSSFDFFQFFFHLWRSHVFFLDLVHLDRTSQKVLEKNFHTIVQQSLKFSLINIFRGFLIDNQSTISSFIIIIIFLKRTFTRLSNSR